MLHQKSREWICLSWQNVRIPAFDLKPSFSITALKRQIYFKAPVLVSHVKMCQERSACPGRAAAHWGSACSSCFPDSKERKLLSSHPGMNLSAQWLLSWEVTGRTEGGRAVLSYKSVAEAALTRTVSKDTTSARMNRWNSVLDIHGGAFTPVLCGEMQYPPGAKRIGSGGSPPPY